MLKRWQLKDMAKEQLRGHWGDMALKSFIMLIIPMGIYAFIALGSAVNFVIQGVFHHRMTVTVPDVAAVFSAIIPAVVAILVGMLSMVLYCGFLEGCMKLRIGQTAPLSIIFSRFKTFPKMLGVYGIYLAIGGANYLAVFLMSRVLLGVFSFLLPVLVLFFTYVMLRFSMAWYIVVENPYTNVLVAFKQSWFIMKGHCWRLYVLNLSFLGWILLSIFTLYIGMLWLYPYVQMTNLNFYYDLKSLHYGSPNAEGME